MLYGINLQPLVTRKNQNSYAQARSLKARLLRGAAQRSACASRALTHPRRSDALNASQIIPAQASGAVADASRSSLGPTQPSGV